MTSPQYLVYVGSYAAAHEPGIRALRFDATSGDLSNAGWSFTGIDNPSFLAVHPNGRWLYAVSETSQRQDGKSGEVWALRLPDAAVDFQEINYQASGGDWPCHLALDHTGRWLLVSNYGSGSVGILPVLEHGALGDMIELVQHHGSGLHPERQTGPHAHSTILSPDNRFAIVADLGIDELVVYAFDAATGRLRPHGHVPARAGAGPRHMAFHPGGSYLYVAHELDNTVVVYSYERERGELIEQQRIETLLPGAPESLVADIHLAPSGDRLYASNRGDDSLTGFAITANGLLERLEVRTCGGHWPRHFAFAPGGQFLLVANQYSHEVTVLDAAKREAPRSHVTIPGAACVQFAPDM